MFPKRKCTIHGGGTLTKMRSEKSVSLVTIAY